MSVGQPVLGTSFDVAALEAAQVLLGRVARDRSALHASRLRAVLRLRQALEAGGFGLAVTAELALLEQLSEGAAAALIEQAQLLASLEGGLAALDEGLLTVEQAAVLTRQLHGLAPELQAACWDVALAALLRAEQRQSVLPPARWNEVLRRAVITVDPADASARRKRAEADGDVEVYRRDDGLGDLTARGIGAVNLRAILLRIRERAQVSGSYDDRKAGKRRLDALVDLLLGRDQLPLDDRQDPFATDEPRHCGPSCGCRLGEPVPCGAGVTVLVPIGAALGTTDELAELEGHGPIEPDVLQDLLHNHPVLRPAWADDDGTLVAVGDTVERPGRDPAAVRDALVRLAGSNPPRAPEPRHPDDHASAQPPEPPAPPPPPPAVAPALAPAPAPAPANALAGPVPEVTRMRLRPPGLVASALRGPEVLTHPHPAGRPGRYRIPTRLARLLRVRAPRCEWPGCGAASARCDLDHDVAWPHGATCGCNLGPLCRHHHRIKQQHWTKLRHDGHVQWTDPGGRNWTSPGQHQPPQRPVRPASPLHDPYGPQGPDRDDDEDDCVEPTHSPDPFTRDDPAGDPFERLQAADDGWGLSLDDPDDHLR